MQKSRVYKLLTWIVICAQIMMVAGTATVGVVQPTPQMVSALAAEAGWSAWLSAGLGVLTQRLQPLWGEPAVAEASSIRDVGPHPGNQWLTTVHPEENWVVNGSFEMGPEGLNITSIPGWTIASGKVDLWGGYFRPDGSSSEIDLAGTPGPGVLEQTISGLTAGQSYFLEFSYSANTFANEQAKVQVLDGATPLLDQTVTAAGTPYSAGWQSFRQTFTAPASGSVKLRFQDLSVDPYTHHGVMIDDVRVAKRLINYVLNGSFEAGPHGLNTTIIPNWTVDSGRVDIHGGYFHPDGSTAEMDLAGTPGPGTASQVVSGLTAGQSYVFEFDYTVNAVANEQARVQVLDGGTPLINQVVTVNGDANHKGWKHFRQSFTAPASGSVTLRFQDLSTDPHTSHGVMIDTVSVADAPLNYVVNGDFENSPAALNIANDAIPGWTVVSGPMDVFNPGLLFDKMVDLNGSPGNGKLEQLVTGLTAGQVYAFQFNYQNHASWTTYAYARLLDSSNAKLYEKRISCKGHVVHEGWCTLRYFFTAPANGQVKIVFENDEADGNAYYGVNIDNVFISRDLNHIVNGNYNAGPTGLNQTKVPGWAVGGPTDTHDNFGGEYRFTVDLNGSPGDGKLRQVAKGLSPGQTYRLRYNYASTAHNYLVNFDVKVTDSTGASTLLSASQSTDQLPYVGGWRQAEHTFTAPADGVVQVNFNNNETDNNPYYAAIIDNIQLWGAAATAGTEVNVCNGTIVLPKPPLTVAPGGVGAGLEHWVRADKDVFSDAGTTAAVEGGVVQQWNDQAGGNLHLTQTTAGQQPTYRAGVARGNFNPTLDFTDDFIRNTSRVLQTTDDLTMIAVGDTDVTGGVRTLIGMGDNYNDPTIDLDGTWISPWFDGGGTVDLFTSETLPTNQGMIWGMRGTNSESNGMRFNYSGEEVPMNMTVANQANYGQNIGLGSDGGGEDWDGRIPEAMVYSRNLSTAEMERIYSYLAVKYGITMRLSTVAGSTASGNYVSSKGALVWNYAGNSNYHNDVAGIARDDASALEQKQANSVNSDNLITIGLGGIAATNAENINTFDADQSFLLWGNDNAATTLATSVSVSLTRMARVWAVQETTPITAPLGLVTLRVPQAAFSLGAGQQAFLLRSVDPVFTNSDTVQFMTCDGANCTTEINFADGDYFTLARANVAPEINITPLNNNFGSVGTSESSPVKNVVISNSGNAPLNLTSIQMTNTGGGQFTNNNSCGATLNPGASCVVGATFIPNAGGVQSGVLTVASNDSDEATTAVNLSGTGVAQAPDITVLPTTLTFGDTIVNSTALAQRVVITNVGTGNLAVQNLTLSGANSDQFVIVPPDSSCTPLTKDLAGGASCDVEVLFSPTSVGAKSANLIIAANDTDEITTTVTLNGAGITCGSALNTVTLMADYLEMIDQDNRAAVCVTIAALPNLIIGKSGPTSATQNTNFAYTLVVTNTSTSASSGVITVTDSLPAGLSFVSGSGGGFTCAASGQNVTCMGSSAIAGNNGTATITLTVNPTTIGAKANTASVIGGGDTSVASSNAVNTTVIGTPDLTTTIGQPSPAFVAGVASNVPMTVSNIGTGPTTGPITTTMTLPANTSAPASFTSNGNTCTTTGQTVTCVNPGPIAPGASNTIQVPVTPNASTVGTSPIFNGTTTTPGDSNSGNNPAAPMTPTAPVIAAPMPTLIIGKGGPVTATQGVNFSYTLVVTNTGTAATSGVITVTDTLPAGMSFVSGSGFTCSATGQIVTCMSSAAIVINGTVIVNLTVTPTTFGVKSNTASVVGGGDTSATSSNTVNTTVSSPNGGIEYKIVYNTALSRYEIWMRSTATPGAPKTTGTAQVTIKAPHLVGAAIFTPTNITAQVANTAWSVTSRTNGPAADTSADYLSFSLDFPTNDHAAINWQAGQEILMVTFQNGGICAGPVSLMENSDPFNVAPNNPGQEIDVTTLGNDPGNDFLGNYNLGQGDCDRDGDGIVNSLDADDDGDGILDATEGTGDTDGDSIPDALDLDSDGDGLPDNLEAQTTAGYMAPNGSVDTNGVDTAYGAGGLTPVNSDGADNADDKDTDSDNAQSNDTIEAALTLSGVDADKDGIDDGVDSNDSTYGPVNAGVTTPATTYPNSNGTGDVDYRDAVTTAPDLITALGQPLPSLMVGVQSNLPVTVTNQGTAPASGPITTTVTLPAGVSAPATFSGGNGWSCTTSGQSVTCINAGPINNGSSSTFTVPVVAATAGSPVTFNTTTAPTSGESNTGNNGATPLTTTTSVAAFVDGCFNTTVTLNGAQETPANGSAATGTAIVVVNTTANKLDYALSFSGLTATMAHIHGAGAPGVSAGVLHSLPGTTSPQVSQWSFAEADQANILGGLTYFNLHSAAYGGGEIRGQIGALAPAACAALTLPIKVILGGAYSSSSGLMTDNLRRLADFPLTSPYGDGASISNSSVLTANNIVDWVLVELHDATTPATVVASKGALLQNDGDVVAVDGVSAISFTGLGSTSYYVVVKHRNHLGVMSAAAVTLSAVTATVDFTNPATAVYGSNTQRTVGSKRVLWAGNANGNTNVISAGPSNDVSTVLGDVLSAPGNFTNNVNYILSGYRRSDTNLDGKTIAAGPNNDINIVLTSVFVHPGNSATAANFIVPQQLP